jgi:hypothetical protein
MPATADAGGQPVSDTPAPPPDPVTPLPARLDGEPARWYSRFIAFALLGPGRSVLAAYNAARARESPRKPAASAPRSWKSAAAAWRWQERAGTWDAAELERRRVADAAAFRDELERHRRNAVAIARVLIGIDVDGLKLMSERLAALKGEEIKAESIPAFLRALAAVGDSALNAECLGLGALEVARSIHGSD